MLNYKTDLTLSQKFTLCYIGMATALGHTLDIPIIICQLANILHQNQILSQPWTFSSAFKHSLDAGSDPEDLSAVVPSYHNPWWTRTLAPADEEMLTFDTLQDCIAHHRKVLGIREIIPPKLLKTAYTWARHMHHSKPNLKCKRCRLYRGVSLAIMDDYQDLQNRVEAFQVAFEGTADAAARQAGIFFQLQQAAELKDVENGDDKSTTKKSKGKAKESTKSKSGQVQRTAAAELTHFQNQPHLKWTSGKPLTTAEVLKVVDVSSHAGQVHSRYFKSLPWGLGPNTSTGTIRRC